MATPINPTWTPHLPPPEPINPTRSSLATSSALDMFARHRLKVNLMNRVLRALRDCPDDEMRLEMLKEIGSMTRLIGALDAVT